LARDGDGGEPPGSGQCGNAQHYVAARRRRIRNEALVIAVSAHARFSLPGRLAQARLPPRPKSVSHGRSIERGLSMRLLPVTLLAFACPALAGCLPMMAVSGASMAARAAAGTPVSDADLQPTARDACTARAAAYGAVHVIDVEQHRVDKIIVWGTVGEG